MRLWTLHPEYLDPQGLLALWREALLARAVLRGETRGYAHLIPPLCRACGVMGAAIEWRLIIHSGRRSGGDMHISQFFSDSPATATDLVSREAKRLHKAAISASLSVRQQAVIIPK